MLKKDPLFNAQIYFVYGKQDIHFRSFNNNNRSEDTVMAELPKHAKVVVIGQGGIVGASVVHHLIEEGWDDIVGLEKSAIPTDIGSTSHASDFCYMTTHDKLNVFTSTYSREFYKKRGNYIELPRFL